MDDLIKQPRSRAYEVEIDVGTGPKTCPVSDRSPDGVVHAAKTGG
jgi:hypothetical protein